MSSVANDPGTADEKSEKSLESVSHSSKVKLSVKDLTIRYENQIALGDVTLDIRENEIFGIIGPANAGKTSFLKALNRMDMFTDGMQVDGEILFDGRNVHQLKNIYALRSRIGVG